MSAVLSRRAALCGCMACFVAALARPIRADEPKPPLSLREVAGGIWVHTSWKTLPGVGHFPSNGAVIAGDGAALVVDTAWEHPDSLLLWAEVQRLTGAPPRRIVVSHAHDDRMSGLAVLHPLGMQSLAHELTQADAPARGLERARETWSGRLHRLDVGGRAVELFHPGAAHTRDNVVAFVPDCGFLFGGCMIRAADQNALGNVADADLAAWPVSARAVAARYGQDAKIVVPGHGKVGDTACLSRTVELADAAAAAAGRRRGT
jgi:glyoxylase-like metal-dependent hydrolase (beta-lactamase superfamily II)